MKLELILLILLITVFYSYIGYLCILLIFNSINSLLKKTDINYSDLQPEVCLIVAAYNEEEFAEIKIKNTLSLNYPKEKLHQIWITDGSTDKTPSIIKNYSDITLLHQDKREGKTAAINRAIKYVSAPIVIFSDANTLLSTNTISEIVKLFNNPWVIA